MKKRKRIYLTIAMAVLTALTSCSGTSTMKGTTYVNSNAENKPMNFMTENVGVLEFTDDKKVDILFPYAIDTKGMEVKGTMASGLLSSELWISGEYEKAGTKITIRFKLREDQKDSGVLEVQIKDDGKTLLGNEGERFNKVNKPQNKEK